jgi:HEAT repeat protein
VRIEVARTLQLIDDPVARQVLLPHLLKDPDKDVRLAGIRILVQLGGPSLEDTLIGSLQQADFTLRGDKEKTLMMVALGRVATTKCLPVIRDLALGSGPIGAQIDRDTQMAALRMLGRVGGSEEVPALEKIARKIFASRELKDAARQAIESIRHRSERQ